MQPYQPKGSETSEGFRPPKVKSSIQSENMNIEELDIPIWSGIKRIELGLCSECGKRKAKFQCDYIIGKTFDLYGKGVITESTCDVYLCEKCTNKLNKKDYCKKHYEELKKEIKRS